MDFEFYMRMFILFSTKTFVDATAFSALEKLKDEIEEVQLDLTFSVGVTKQKLTEEYIDCMMCIIDSAARAGITISELRSAFMHKLIINQQRKWIKNPDNTYSHE